MFHTTKAGWHFLPASRRLGYRDGRRVRKGVPIAMRHRRGGGRPLLCIDGMHAATTIGEAAQYTRGPILCRVRVGGSSFQMNADGKFVGRVRTVVWWRQITIKDAQKLGEAMGRPYELGIVAMRLKNHAKANRLKFNQLLEAWARRHGAPRARR